MIILKKDLLDDFMRQYFDAKEKGISLNLFCILCANRKKYDIDQELVDAFISSMYKDLGDIKYENRKIMMPTFMAVQKW